MSQIFFYRWKMISFPFQLLSWSEKSHEATNSQSSSSGSSRKRTCTLQKAFTLKRIPLLLSIKHSPSSLSSNGNKLQGDMKRMTLLFLTISKQRFKIWKKINLAADFLTSIQMVNLLGGPKSIEHNTESLCERRMADPKTKK